MKIRIREKYKQMSPAARTSLWFTFCNFLQRGTAFITVPVFTRLLTTEEYGICNIYFAWFDIFLMFTSLKIPYEGLNNGLIRYEEEKDSYTSSVMGLIMVTTVISGGIYLVFHTWIDRITGLSGSIMTLMFIQLLFNPPLMLWTNRERFDFRYRLPAAVTIISTVLNLIITVSAVLNTTYKAEARIIASAAVQTFFGLILTVVLMKKGRSFFRREYWIFALKFNLPLIFYYISQVILSQSDRLMINYFEGSGKAAVYSVAYSAATIIQLVVSAVNGSFNPWMYKKIKAGMFREIRPVASALCMMVAGATLVLSVLAPDLIRILATEEYMEAVWIIAPVSASVYFIFLYMLFANVEMYYGENGGISAVSIICSAANFVLNAIFIPVFGYIAAGWTTLICYMMLTILHYILMKKACRKRQAEENIFFEKQLLMISAGVVLSAFAVLLLYKAGEIRYLVFAAAAVLIFLFRKKLLPILIQVCKGEK